MADLPRQRLGGGADALIDPVPGDAQLGKADDPRPRLLGGGDPSRPCDPGFRAPGFRGAFEDDGSDANGMHKQLKG